MSHFTQEINFSPQILLLIGLGGGTLLLIWLATSKSGSGSLNIKSKTVGDGPPAGPRPKKSPRHIREWYSMCWSGGRAKDCPERRG